jgi:hypothetical protein
MEIETNDKPEKKINLSRKKTNENTEFESDITLMFD